MTLANVQNSQTKYGTLTAKEAEKIPWNKLCLDLIGTYVIRRKVNKDILSLKVVTMIDPATGWSKIMQYGGKIVI